MAEEIAAQRAEIEELVAGLERAVEDLEGAAEAFGGEEMEGVKVELERSSAAGVGLGR